MVVRRAERFTVPGAAGRLLVEQRLGESQPKRRGLSEFSPSVFSNSESGGVYNWDKNMIQFREPIK